MKGLDLGAAYSFSVPTIKLPDFKLPSLPDFKPPSLVPTVRPSIKATPPTKIEIRATEVKNINSYANFPDAKKRSNLDLAVEQLKKHPYLAAAGVTALGIAGYFAVGLAQGKSLDQIAKDLEKKFNKIKDSALGAAGDAAAAAVGAIWSVLVETIWNLTKGTTGWSRDLTDQVLKGSLAGIAVLYVVGIVRAAF